MRRRPFVSYNPSLAAVAPDFKQIRLVTPRRIPNDGSKNFAIALIDEFVRSFGADRGIRETAGLDDERRMRCDFVTLDIGSRDLLVFIIYPGRKKTLRRTRS
jgi:hypothetical protein